MSQEIGIRKSEERFAHLANYLKTASTEISSVENLSSSVRQRYNEVRSGVFNNFLKYKFSMFCSSVWILSLLEHNYKPSKTWWQKIKKLFKFMNIFSLDALPMHAGNISPRNVESTISTSQPIYPPVSNAEFEPFISKVNYYSSSYRGKCF